MTKGSKKSIIASFASFTETQPASSDNGGGGTATPASPFSPRVGASVIGATQRSLTELREERDRLQALVEAGGTREIDPALLDPSPFQDRMPDDDDGTFESFKRQLAEEGQKIPIEVRPHPETKGRYQIVYGHRRWRAARDLGIPLKAIVTTKSDGEAALAQGIENAARQDLTWIERALFAATLEKAGLKTREIRAALSIDDPELARFRGVLRTLPDEIVRAIGRAPKAGRPRWVEFAKLAAERPDGIERIRESLAAAKDAPSDMRLQSALAAMKARDKPVEAVVELRDRDRRLVGKAAFAKGGVKLVADRAVSQDFEAFLREDLDALVQRFEDWRRRRERT